MTLELASRTDGGPSVYRFQTREGVHSHDSFRASELGLLEHCWERRLGDLLVVQANYGVLGTVLATRAGSATLTETSARAAACCRSNLRENGVSASVRVLPSLSELDGRFDTVVYAPRPYTPVAVASQRLAEALDRLAPDGDLYVAGRPESGIERYRSRLRELADAATVDEHDSVSVLRAAGPASLDVPSYVQPRQFETTVGDVDLSLVTEPGLFAARGLDDGTRLLLETLDVADGDRVLDLCCGYGPVGSYTALTADCSVVCTDENARATRCAERTLAANGVDADVVTADCLDGVRDRSFDLVACNPPTHAGSDVLRDLFSGTREVLASDGRFLVVHHRGVDLSGHLRPFGTVRTVASGPDHVVEVAPP